MAGKTNHLRCAIYTRKSTEHGLELEFNSLDAQREACEAYIKSQASQGWKVLPQPYDDPAYSGGNLERPALKKLLADIEAGKVDVVVVCGFRGLRPWIPIERDHAVRSKAVTCSDEGGRGVVAGMRTGVRFSWLRQVWRAAQ